MVAQQNDLSLIHSHLFWHLATAFIFLANSKFLIKSCGTQKKEHADHTLFFFFSNIVCFSDPDPIHATRPPRSGRDTEPTKRTCERKNHHLRQIQRNRFTTGELGPTSKRNQGKTENAPVQVPPRWKQKDTPTIGKRGFFILWNGFERGTMESDLGLVR